MDKRRASFRGGSEEKRRGSLGLGGGVGGGGGGVMAGLPERLLNSCHKLQGGEPGVKAPARWPGHEQNTDLLSLESSATPHAALEGRGQASFP